MSVWFCIPSKRAPREANKCFAAWRRQGYNIAVMREPQDGLVNVDITLSTERYLGWAASVNRLAEFVLRTEADAEWIVTGGDDYWPDPNKRADEIARECVEHYRGYAKPFGTDSGTYGVMQPTGDPWSDSQGRIIERIAGSPWLGREWCKRAFGGRGPMPDAYFHNFADEELQLVAHRLGVFWQRPDLIQEHRHPVRARGDYADAPEWWRKNIGRPGLLDSERKIFNDRRAAGFPGSDPL